MSFAAQAPRNRLSFPAVIRPKLAGGRVHQVVIDDDGLTISTLAGFYGHTQSQSQLYITRNQLSQVAYLPPRWWRGARCKVVYRDGAGETRTLTFAAVDNEVSSIAGFTALAAQVLNAVRTQDSQAEPVRYEYTLQPIRTSVKLLYLPLGLAGALLLLLLLRFGLDSGSLFFVGFVAAFVGSAALAATLIDRIRLHTGWPLALKAAAALLAFVVTLIVFLVIMGILDMLA